MIQDKRTQHAKTTQRISNRALTIAACDKVIKFEICGGVQHYSHGSFSERIFTSEAFLDLKHFFEFLFFNFNSHRKMEQLVKKAPLTRDVGLQNFTKEFELLKYSFSLS
jgi:hypothetical protein